MWYAGASCFRNPTVEPPARRATRGLQAKVPNPANPANPRPDPNKAREPELTLSLSLPLLPSLSTSSEEDLCILEQLVTSACDLGKLEHAEEALGMLRGKFGGITVEVVEGESGKSDETVVKGSSRVGVLEGKLMEAKVSVAFAGGLAV